MNSYTLAAALTVAFFAATATAAAAANHPEITFRGTFKGNLILAPVGASTDESLRFEQTAYLAETASRTDVLNLDTGKLDSIKIADKLHGYVYYFEFTRNHCAIVSYDDRKDPCYYAFPFYVFHDEEKTGHQTKFGEECDVYVGHMAATTSTQWVSTDASQPHHLVAYSNVGSPIEEHLHMTSATYQPIPDSVFDPEPWRAKFAECHKYSSSVLDIPSWN